MCGGQVRVVCRIAAGLSLHQYLGFFLIVGRRKGRRGDCFCHPCFFIQTYTQKSCVILFTLSRAQFAIGQQKPTCFNTNTMVKILCDSKEEEQHVTPNTGDVLYTNKEEEDTYASSNSLCRVVTCKVLCDDDSNNDIDNGNTDDDNNKEQECAVNDVSDEDEEQKEAVFDIQGDELEQEDTPTAVLYDNEEMQEQTIRPVAETASKTTTRKREKPPEAVLRMSRRKKTRTELAHPLPSTHTNIRKMRKYR